jgi:tetratricopeptide (TPR) repeat protein
MYETGGSPSSGSNGHAGKTPVSDKTDKADPLETQAQTVDTPKPKGDPLTSPHHGSHSDSTSGRLEVRCPNCHQPTEVAADTTLTDLICSACGSHFSLVDQSQATRMAPSLTRLGRFDLIERLGVGGFGSVWKARDKELDRTVAIKIPRAGGMSPEQQEKFFREARAAAQLRHPRIVSVHEVGRDGDSVYIVSDFVRGVTLGDWLTGQKLTGREAAELCAKVADALHHAHEHGIVHRDLKPANVIIDYDGEPHLMDFGLARRESGEVTVTMDGQLVGTPAYMSPEQAQGEAHTADRRSDIYSLGAILFQLLTGELPFRGNARMLVKQVIHDEPPSPRKLNGNIPKDLETITLKCLEKEPNKRYQTANDLQSELRRYLSGEPIQARPIGRFARGWRWAKRNPRVAVLTASVAVLLVAVAAVSLIGFAVARRQQLAAQEAATREASLRSLAEENLALAEKAVDDYLTRVADDSRLKQNDFSALRTQLLETAIPFYEQFAAQKPGDAQRESNRAKAYTRLAIIHSETGQGKKSLADYEKAVAVLAALVERFPSEPEYQADLAANHKTLGWNLYLSGNILDAEKHYQQALSLFDKLAKEFPDDGKGGYRHGISSTCDVYGILLRRRDLDAARIQFERSLALNRALAKGFPDVAGYKAAVAVSLNQIGQLLRSKQPVEARPYLAEAVEIQRDLVGRFSDKWSYRSDLAESVCGLAGVTSDAATAQALYEEAVAINKKLADDFPAVIRIRSNLAVRYLDFGVFFLRAGAYKNAFEQFDIARALYEQLAQQAPDIPAHWTNAAKTLDFAARCLPASDVRVTEYRERAVKCYEYLAAEFPGEPRYRAELAARHKDFAESLFDGGDSAAALPHFERAVNVYSQLVADFEKTSSYRKSLALTCNNFAWRLATSPNDEARDGKRAVELATKACELDNYKDAIHVDTLAAAYAEAGDFDAAAKWSQESIQLLGKRPDVSSLTTYWQAFVRYKARKPTRLEASPTVNVARLDWAGAGSQRPKFRVQIYRWEAAGFKQPPEKWQDVIAGSPIDEQAIDFVDYRLDDASPTSKSPADYFAIVATTERQLPAGDYKVCTAVDDGVRVFVDDKPIIDKWHWSPTARHEANVHLNAGSHKFRIEYFEIDGSATLQFWLVRPD